MRTLWICAEVVWMRLSGGVGLCLDYGLALALEGTTAVVTWEAEHPTKGTQKG